MGIRLKMRFVLISNLNRRTSNGKEYMNSVLLMKLYFVLLMKSHLQSYPCPLQINSFWNLGFLLGVAIILQIITGIFLALHYTSDLNSAYFSLFFLVEHHLSFFFYFYILEELCFMVHTFIIQILGFQEFFFSSMYNRMGLWRILCLQSNIEEVLSLSFCFTI